MAVVNDEIDAVSVIIPAHNEAVSLPRLLAALVSDGLPNQIEVIVVCNGCTDNTAERARSFPGVQIFEIAEASKAAAIAEGDRQAAYAIRAYIDADVVLERRSLVQLVAAVGDGMLAVAPERRLDRRNVSVWVGWYYDVWERLPQVRSGLFGRGVVVLSEHGRERITALPQMMSDDLLMSEAFPPSHRRVVAESEVVIRLPRNMGDLMRRRIRVNTGNAQMDSHGLRSAAAKTSMRALLAIAAQSPANLPKLLVFGSVTVAAKFRARRQIGSADFSTWLRDESSRVG
jgi:glycosyltransferase involved in cell wall biosynthesis